MRGRMPLVWFLVPLFCWALCSNAWGCAIINQRGRPSAKGEITLKIVDSQGCPVEGALCDACFLRSDVFGDYEHEEAMTDAQGRAAFKGTTYGEMTFQIKKDGYYATAGRYWFLRPSEQALEVGATTNHAFYDIEFYPPGERGGISGGRWTPWNPEIEVTLKEHRHPIPLVLHTSEFRRKECGEPVGFDVEIGDWVAPYGRGENADFVVGLQGADTGDGENGGSSGESPKVILSAGEPPNGFVQCTRETWSRLSSQYEAPEDGYVPDIVPFVQLRGNPRHIIRPHDYLFLRCRAVTDESGKIIHANYAKIYGMRYRISGEGTEKGTFTLETGPMWFNAVDLDRNLEYDPDRNLNPKGYRHFETQ